MVIGQDYYQNLLLGLRDYLYNLSLENGPSFFSAKFHFQHIQSCCCHESVHLYSKYPSFSSFPSFSAEHPPHCLSLVPLALSDFWIDAVVQLVSVWKPDKMRGLPQCSQWKDICRGQALSVQTEVNRIRFILPCQIIKVRASRGAVMFRVGVNPIKLV